MRIQLSRAERNDDGAVAVIVAILASVLILMAAFAVDLGNAYAVKRQLSVAADAAALDAARAVANTKSGGVPILGGGTGCADWTSTEQADAEASATEAANATNLANDLSENLTVDDVAVECVVDPSGPDRVEVRVDNSRELPLFFGGISNLWNDEDIDGYTPIRTATAAVQPVLGVGDLRPFAVCDLVIDQARTQPGTTFTIDISNQRGICSGSSSGNWGLADFNNGGRACSETSEWTEDGYPDPVVAPDPDLHTKPGNCINSLRTELQGILDQVVLFPVVSGYTPGSGAGATGRFDLVGFVAAKVCGYAGRSFSQFGTCYDPVQAAPYLSASPREEFIQFRYVDYSTGYSGGGPTCDFTEASCKYAILSAQLYR